MRLPEVFEIFGPQKDFHGRWLGSPRLNRWGLHPARMLLSDAMLELRRAQVRLVGRGFDVAALRREGIQVIPDFLAPDLFERTREEVRNRMAELRREVPFPARARGGFGDPIRFPGGFDRYDGDTLNRYVELDSERTAGAWHAVRSSRVAALCERASGFRHRPERFSIYQTVHGTDRGDIQKVLHRDTFQAAVKLWLFLEPVSIEQGPFTYVPGSHRLNRERLAWERERAVETSLSTKRNKGGSFRISIEELRHLDLPEPVSYPVAANTLIIADVRGFHRRGAAERGAERLSLYASLRMGPFSPVVY